MASSGIDVIAIIYPAEGKTDRVAELLQKVLEHAQANEPGTLKYEMHREIKGGDIVMVEQYAGTLPLWNVTDKQTNKLYRSTERVRHI